jgi:hypothetical protein
MGWKGGEERGWRRIGGKGREGRVIGPHFSN